MALQPTEHVMSKPSDSVKDCLTLRQYYAGLAMAAYASADYVGNSGTPHEVIAEWAVGQSDALINALNK